MIVSFVTTHKHIYPDPKIIQDVQRALELQSRRRDRKSFTPSQPTVIEDQTLIELRQDTSFQHSPPASPPTFTHPSRPPLDIDFSPSVQAVPLHPVPLSSNAGATLDWTGSQSEEERLEKRWTLGKRKGKDRPSFSNKAVLEKQDTLFAGELLETVATESHAYVAAQIGFLESDRKRNSPHSERQLLLATN